MKSTDSNESVWRIALTISGAGVISVAYILLGILAGDWLAKIWDGPKLWVGLGAIVGMVLGIANIIWMVRKFIGGTR